MSRNNENTFSLTVLGARGSIPVFGDKYKEYGGATSSYLVKAGDDIIILDAGLGIMDAPKAGGSGDVSILLSHPHLDHLMGLPFFLPLFDTNRHIDLYAAGREGRSAAETINGLYSPPYWPCTLSSYPACFVVHELNKEFSIGGVRIQAMEVSHPGGSTAYRLSFNGRSLVYLSDYEQPKKIDPDLVEFVGDTDLLLCDAQYTDEEYQSHKGYGHSTPAKAIALKEASGAGRLILIHHDPFHDDEFLRKAQKKLEGTDVLYAKRQEVYEI